MGWGTVIEYRFKIREGEKGWSDEQVLMSLILHNLDGGDCVRDVEVLPADDGFCRVLKVTDCLARSADSSAALT